MASRRELKKNVNYIAGELFTECLINSMFIPGTDKVKADELMAEVLKMQDEFVTRISHTEPDRKSTRLNSSHPTTSRMPSSA